MGRVKLTLGNIKNKSQLMIITTQLSSSTDTNIFTGKLEPGGSHMQAPYSQHASVVLSNPQALLSST
jgi:hypothetical protein